MTTARSYPTTSSTRCDARSRSSTTIVKVDFIDPRILVEIEAEAVYGGADELPDGKANTKR
jgi:hypothetical protein